MFSKMTKVLILAGSLIVAGTASASDRNVIVPVIAGAAVGAVLATVLSNSSNDHHRRPDYRGYQPQPRYQPRYQPQYQPVAYVPARVEYRRGPPPRNNYYDGGHHHRDDRGYDHARW